MISVQFSEYQRLWKRMASDFPLATCCVFLIRIRKPQSSLGNSSCLAKTENLLFYLWKKLAPEEFYGKLFASLKQICFMLSPENNTNEVIAEILQELTTDHEEADTLVLLLLMLFVSRSSQTTGQFDSALPPCQNSLWLHATRINYQAAI